MGLSQVLYYVMEKGITIDVTIGRYNFNPGDRGFVVYILVQLEPHSKIYRSRYPIRQGWIEHLTRNSSQSKLHGHQIARER